MAANKDYQSEGAPRAAPKTQPAWLCPACGKTAHVSRRFCRCGEALNHAAAAHIAGPPDIGPCNFEIPGLSCDDCPEDCLPCAGYGIPEAAFSGFGGKNCRSHAGTPRCYCCQAQIKIAINLRKQNISEIIGGVLAKRKSGKETGEGKNVFLVAAEIILEETAKPVRARIERYEAASLGVPLP
jgi:hypothetical protein